MYVGQRRGLGTWRGRRGLGGFAGLGVTPTYDQYGNISRNAYNVAVQAYQDLITQRQVLWDKQLATVGYWPGGTTEQLLVLAPEIAAATQLVRDWEALFNSIATTQTSLTPEQLADQAARTQFLNWFNGIFKPTFSSTAGATTNEDTLRREMTSYGWVPANHPEWADEVLAWIRSSSVAWKLAPGSQPFPVPGATSITYAGGTVYTPTQGQLAPSVSQPAGTTVAPTPTIPSVSSPEVTASVPPTGTYVTGGRVIQDGTDVGAAPRSGGSASYAGGSDATVPAEAGFGGLGGFLAIGAVVGLLLMSRKAKR